jgi:hypothetical protein
MMLDGKSPPGVLKPVESWLDSRTVEERMLQGLRNPSSETLRMGTIRCVGKRGRCVVRKEGLAPNVTKVGTTA